MGRRNRRHESTSKTARRVKSLRAVTEYTKRFLEGKNVKLIVSTERNEKERQKENGDIYDNGDSALEM